MDLAALVGGVIAWTDCFLETVATGRFQPVGLLILVLNEHSL
jgi:hypothetical protein